MLNKKRAAAVNAQIRAYKDFTMVAMAIIPVIEQFDCKVYNKRFVDALNGATLPDGCDVYFSVKKEYEFDIECRTQNRSYKENPDSNGYCSTSYIDYDSMTVRTPKDEALKDGRINAAAIIEQLKKQAAYYKDCAGSLEYARDNYNSMVNELQDIADRLKDFNNRFDYSVREVIGLNFEIVHRGSNNDYVIKAY
jgi:hypothetical protein